MNPLQHSAWRSCIVNACVPSARFEKLAAFEMTFLKCSCVRVGQGPGTGLFASGAALRCRSDWESAVFWRFDGLAMRRFADRVLVRRRSLRLELASALCGRTWSGVAASGEGYWNDPATRAL